MAITTNREFIKAMLKRFNVSDDDVDIIILEHPELNGSLNVKACKYAIYSSLSAVLPTSDMSEGGFSLSWDIERLKLWYKSLCKEIGMPNALGPSIRNKSNIW